jgi:mono/diheme cytochrome c family protein
MWRYSLPAAALLLTACTQYPSGGSLRLHTDMMEQPSYRAQENPRVLPPGAVARNWEAPLTPAVAAKLENAEPATAESLAQGKTLFNIYCTPCHGASGRGDGTVAAKITKPADLTSAKYAAATDGFLCQVIRTGSGLMPGYAESLFMLERWHVVNYLRSLEKP